MGRPARLTLVGAAGRMGRRLDALAAEDERLDVTGRVDAGGPGLDALDPGSVDCVVDFSVQAQARATCAFCADHGVPLVMGTTGLEEDDRAAIREVGARAPVVWAPNYSVGVNALFALAGELATMMGEGFDLELVEAHHRHKVDAPSGTARRLVEILADARGTTYGDAAVCGREGLVGARSDEEIGVSVVRGGDVVGEHTVHFAGPAERLELTHKAGGREIFAAGAVRAAQWTAARPPGLYSMRDVLGV